MPLFSRQAANGRERRRDRLDSGSGIGRDCRQLVRAYCDTRSLGLQTVRGFAQPVEVYRLALDPGARHVSAGHAAGVTEHLLVTSGRARVGRSGEESELDIGQAATWISDVEHTYAALDDRPVESVLVITSPATR